MYCADSEVLHLGGGTLNTENPFKTYLNFRNNLLLLKKNLPFGRSFVIIGARFWMDMLALLRFLNEGKRKDAWAVSRAHQYFVRNIFKSERIKGSYTKRLKGMYKGSIVYDFFMKKKTKFTDLDQENFY
jgi:GT2 family glycosyltransferase